MANGARYHETIKRLERFLEEEFGEATDGTRSTIPPSVATNAPRDTFELLEQKLEAERTECTWHIRRRRALQDKIREAIYAIDAWRHQVGGVTPRNVDLLRGFLAKAYEDSVG